MLVIKVSFSAARKQILRMTVQWLGDCLITVFYSLRPCSEIDRVRGHGLGVERPKPDFPCLHTGKDCLHDGQKTLLRRIVRPQREDSAPLQGSGQPLQTFRGIEAGMRRVEYIAGA